MTRREIPLLPSTPGPIAAAGLLASLMVGVLMAGHLHLGIGLLIGLIYAPLVLLNLPLGIAVWVSMVFVQQLPFVSFGPTVALILIGLAWIGTIRERADVAAAIVQRHRRLLTTLALLVAWLALTALWAEKPSLVGVDWWQWLVSSLMFVIIATTISTRRNIEFVVGAFVFGALVSVVIGLIGGGIHSSATAIDTATEKEGRLQGGAGDPNYLAAGLVPAIVLATALMSLVRGLIVRWFLLMAIGIIAIGFAASESRGGLLAAAVTLLAMVILYRRRRAQMIVWVALAASVAAIWFSAYPDAWTRVTSFNDAGNGRADIWRVARSIWQDHPIAGVGLNNFRAVAPKYVRKPGSLHSVALIAEKPHVVHNVYLQLLVETGVIGLGLYLAVIVSCLRAAQLAWRRFDQLGERALATLARALAVALIGELAASFFISNGTDFRLWILLALGPALLGLASRPANQLAT